MLILFSAVCALPFALSLLASAQATFLTESEVIDLSIEALSGKKSSQKKIIEEYRKYETLIQEKASFTPLQKKLYDEIVESIQIFAPHVLPSLEAKKDKIIVQKPQKDKEIKTRKQKDSQWEADANKFFPFKVGTVTVYVGRSKNIFAEEWLENGKTLRSIVLKTKKERDGKIESLLLNEVLTQQEQYLAEQSLERFQLSSKGVLIQKEVVLNQPFPGNYLPVGRQEPYTIAQLPIREGAVVGGYKVTTVSATVATGGKEFQEAVVIKGTVENFYFAPHFGLVRREIYDEQWLLKERILTNIENEKLEPKEQSALVRKIRKFCRKQGLKYQFPISFVIREKKESEPTMRVMAQVLAYRRDRRDPDQKRYQIVRQEWVRMGKGKKVNWELR